MAAHAAGAPSPCTIELSFSNTAEEAPVTSTSPATVTFNGNFTATLPPLAGRASVSFESMVDAGWGSAVSPGSAIITQSISSGSIAVTVVAPAGALPGQVGTATVKATMVVSGLQCEDTYSGLSVTPLPYFDGFTGMIYPRNVTMRDGAASFTLAVGAKANVPVAVTLEYLGPDGLAFDGPSSVALPPPGSGPMEANVTVRLSGDGLAEGAYQIEIIVRGTTAEGLSQQGQLLAPLEVSPDLQGDPPLGSSVSLLGIAVAAGLAAVGAVWWWRR